MNLDQVKGHKIILFHYKKRVNWNPQQKFNNNHNITIKSAKGLRQKYFYPNIKSTPCQIILMKIKFKVNLAIKFSYLLTMIIK